MRQEPSNPTGQSINSSRCSEPWVLLVVMFLSAFAVVSFSLSQACAQNASASGSGGVPKVRASDHRGLDIGAATETYVRELPSGALVDRNLANGTGYTGYQIDDMARMAKKENVIIGARSTNIDSMRHIRDGRAVPKPLTIKSKTITDLDTYLGARPKDKGLVGYFKPKRPDKNVVPPSKWDETWKRYLDRKKEYKKLQAGIKELENQGEVVVKDGKVHAVLHNADGAVLQNPDGTTKIKPYAGDIDAVYFKDAKTGNYIRSGKKYDRLKRRWMGLPDDGAPDYWSRSGAPGQHGAEANLVSDLTEGLKKGTPEFEEALKKAQKLHTDLGENHWKKGEVVLEMRPDGNLRRGTRFTKDTPLPDLHRAGDVAEDLSKGGGTLDDAARAADSFGDAAKVSRARKILSAGVKAMEVLGKVATAVEVAQTASQIGNMLSMMKRATDPSITDEEANALLKKADELAKTLIENGTFGAVLEAFPPIAAIYGTWVLTYHGGQLVLTNTKTGQSIIRAAGKAINLDAGADFINEVSGRTAQQKANEAAVCKKIKDAIAAGRMVPVKEFTAEQICYHMATGGAEAVKDMFKPGTTKQLCASLEGEVATATILVDKGDLTAAQDQLTRTRAKLANTAAPQACAGLDGRIAGQLGRITGLVAAQRAKAQAALAACDLKKAGGLINSLPEGSRGDLVKSFNAALDAEKNARTLIAQAQALEGQGEFGQAMARLDEAGKPKPCPATAAAINEAINRIGQKGVAAAEAALGACQFKKSHKLINKLPEGSRGTLVARWNKAYERERKARDLVVQAKALEDSGKPDGAIDTLRRARNLPPCERTISAIDRAISRIEQGKPRARISDAEAALGRCEFKNSRNLIKQLPDSARARLAGRWNEAYEKERKARDLIVQAKALEDSGKPGRTIGKLHQARNLDPCERTISAIDRAITRILQGAKEKKEQRIAKVNARCRSKHGSGYYAGPIDSDGTYYCLPTQATANAWCRDNNEGSGWSAGTVKYDGTHDCNQSAEGARDRMDREGETQQTGGGTSGGGGRFRCPSGYFQMFGVCQRQE